MKYVTIGEIFPDTATRTKLTAFVNLARSGALTLPPGQTVRVALKEQFLEPERARLEKDWNLDYLSWALCYILRLPL